VNLLESKAIKKLHLETVVAVTKFQALLSQQSIHALLRSGNLKKPSQVLGFLKTNAGFSIKSANFCLTAVGYGHAKSIQSLNWFIVKLAQTNCRSNHFR
jgi:hypothetical protein